MSWTRRAITLACLAVLGGCTGFYQPAVGPVGESHRPQLEAAWAEENVVFSDLWRIYIRASDPDGDLDKVWVTFTRFGGTYPGTFVRLTQPHRTANGYIQLWARPKGGSNTRELPIYATAEVRVEDRAGNQSGSRVLPFVILNFRGPNGSAPPAGFERENRLAEMEMNMELELGDDGGDRGGDN